MVHYKKRPYVIINVGASIDGKISTRTGDSAFSSDADIQRVHLLRSRVDAILIGKNTAIQDNPMLTVRYTQKKKKSPVRIILDSNAEITKMNNNKIIITSGEIPTIIAVSKAAKKENLSKLAETPIEVITSGEVTVDIEDILDILAKRGIKKVLVEGGGTINWEFIKHGWWDELIVAIAPCVVGDKKAISMIQGEGYAELQDSPKLYLKGIERLENHVVLSYVRV